VFSISDVLISCNVHSLAFKGAKQAIYAVRQQFSQVQRELEDAALAAVRAVSERISVEQEEREVARIVSRYWHYVIADTGLKLACDEILRYCVREC